MNAFQSKTIDLDFFFPHQELCCQCVRGREQPGESSHRVGYFFEGFFFKIYFFPIAWKSQLQKGFRRNPTTTPHGSVSQDLFLCLWSKSFISSCKLRSLLRSVCTACGKSPARHTGDPEETSLSCSSSHSSSLHRDTWFCYCANPFSILRTALITPVVPERRWHVVPCPCRGSWLQDFLQSSMLCLALALICVQGWRNCHLPL